MYVVDIRCHCKRTTGMLGIAGIFSSKRKAEEAIKLSMRKNPELPGRKYSGLIEKNYFITKFVVDSVKELNKGGLVTECTVCNYMD